jgi:CheY-like chemotaxis protein
MNADLTSILLVEDDPGDVMLIREALAEHKVANTLSVVSDGVKAMEFLRGEGEYAATERPGLVLLDLNLPRKSGAEVLAEIKGDPSLSTIPVVVLTTSEAEEDVLRSYQQHANAYVTKPVDFECFKRIVHQIDNFFIGLVKLPPRTRAGG